MNYYYQFTQKNRLPTKRGADAGASTEADKPGGEVGVGAAPAAFGLAQIQTQSNSDSASDRGE